MPNETRPDRVLASSLAAQEGGSLIMDRHMKTAREAISALKAAGWVIVKANHLGSLMELADAR